MARTVVMNVVGVEDNPAIIEVTTVSPRVRLSSAMMSLNGGPWMPISPQDGLFDDRTETFRFVTDVLKPGGRVIVVRVQDVAGNVGNGDAMFAAKRRE